jgi:transcriptional regulator with XRE-family HTH domain
MDGMSEEPLSQLVWRRIETAYGGNQSAFARKVGLGPSYVNQLLKGKVMLPRAEKRRDLARELGISHIALLVSAGELTEEEAGPQLPPYFDPSDERAQIVDKLRLLSDSNHIRYIDEGLDFLLRSQREVPMP